MIDDRAFKKLSGIYPEEINFLEQDDPFRFLVSVVLSAQTTDKKVNEVGKILFAKWPDAESLSKAKREEVEEVVHPLGFYRMKAANIIALAEAIAERGGIPGTIEELVTLPGVGRKTANCYVGHIEGKGAVIVDTHFGRVATRLGYTTAKTPEKIEEEIRAGFPEEDLFRLSMVLNLHGRKYCHAKKPDCAGCPVSDLCPSALQA